MSAFIFQHTWEWILKGSPYTGVRKTQTSRLVKPGEKQFNDLLNVNGRAILTKMVGTGTIDEPHDKWRTGRDYCIRPSRTAPAVLWRMDPAEFYMDYEAGMTVSGREWKRAHMANGWQEARIRILNIWRQDVRMIDNHQVRAEGWENPVHFWQTWVYMHDKAILSRLLPLSLLKNQLTLQQQTERALSILLARPDRFYDAWMITFELVQ